MTEESFHIAPYVMSDPTGGWWGGGSRRILSIIPSPRGGLLLRSALDTRTRIIYNIREKVKGARARFIKL